MPQNPFSAGVPDPVAGANNAARTPSWLERGTPHPRTSLPRRLSRLDLAAFCASLLDVFGVSIATPTAPRFTPDPPPHMTVFKCIRGLAPQYLADDCVLASTVRSRRHLWSADTMKLVVQRTKTVIGTRAFAVAATVWNRLPADIRTSTCTVQTFAQKLKTFYASRRI